MCFGHKAKLAASAPHVHPLSNAEIRRQQKYQQECATQVKKQRELEIKCKKQRINIEKRSKRGEVDMASYRRLGQSFSQFLACCIILTNISGSALTISFKCRLGRRQAHSKGINFTKSWIWDRGTFAFALGNHMTSMAQRVLSMFCDANAPHSTFHPILRFTPFYISSCSSAP